MLTANNSHLSITIFLHFDDCHTATYYSRSKAIFCFYTHFLKKLFVSNVVKFLFKICSHPIKVRAIQ